MSAVDELLLEGVFLPREVYAAMPVALPFAVRDLSCRGGSTGARGDRDAWGSPDARGFMRDDNTMVKGLVRSLTVSRTGSRLGNGFTAAHVWRIVRHAELASKIPMLYSFVPNIVWLPRDLAKLTDTEGGPYQRALQSVSWAVYRTAEVSGPMHSIAEEAWSLIPDPQELVEVNDDDLTWFVSNARTMGTNLRRVSEVIKALADIEAGAQLPRRVVCSRYATGLPDVDFDRRRDLLAHLRRFVPQSESPQDDGAEPHMERTSD